MESRRRNVYLESIHEKEEVEPTKPKPDIVIVGAGVAGAALAYALAKDERRIQVHVIERDLSEPDRMVGEVLQPGGYLKLKDLGLQDCVEDIDAQPMVGYAVFKDGESAKLSYHALTGTGTSFHNGRFIQRMRRKAASLPNVQLTQGTVTSLLEENGTVKGVQYKTKKTGSQELINYMHAPLTIVCDGCFSNLRRSLCLPKVDILSSFVGLVLENCRLPFPNHGHVILANPSPILFYSIGANEIRCLVDVPGEKLPSIAKGDMSKHLKAHVGPQVPPELHGAFVHAVDKGNIRTMRNGSMPAALCTKPGALMIGDAFNMRHALTGGGMTVALTDVVVLRNILRGSIDLNDTDRILRSFYASRKAMAFTMNTLAGAAYKLSCASDDRGRKELHEAVFSYLKVVGSFSRGPVSLLSGLNLHPMNLLLQSSAVAVYGVGRLLIPFPNTERVWSVVRLTKGASGIIYPIVKAEGVTEMMMLPLQRMIVLIKSTKCRLYNKQIKMYPFIYKNYDMMMQ